MAKFSNINFENYGYYPRLRTRVAELNGLRHLTDERKDKIIPLLSLGKWPKATNFDGAANKIPEIFQNRPYFLDLTDEKNTYADDRSNLKSSHNGYENWINYIQKFENAIPILQIENKGSLRDFTQQARKCENFFGKLGFVIQDFNNDINKVISALSSIDDVENAMVFIDSKYIRNSYPAILAANIAAINKIREDIPSANITTLSTSFPSSLASFSNNGQGRTGAIEILERQLHGELGGYEVSNYGDYASIHGVVYDDAPEIMRWAARVDYPKEQNWLFERRPKCTAKSDFQDAAKAILEDNPEIGTRDIWGEKMIKGTACDPNFDEIGFGPASWISVRVNIHLSKQIDFSEMMLSSPEEELDEDLDF